VNKLLELWLQKCDLFLINEEGLHFHINETIDLGFSTKEDSAAFVPKYYYDRRDDENEKIYIFLVAQPNGSCKVWFDNKEDGPCIEKIFSITEANPTAILNWLRHQAEADAFGTANKSKTNGKKICEQSI
jgi:hypothetical protein